ncbi:MAG: nicotinate-nucleotide adenylyltransferase [Proteobacteria bacterium]|nr:nicotinate-nucleotide adenylyltransferase [Pseudomonadota bacterium]MBU1737371.1 nicotinate-nucleotide adenylyltransferase [Pseudomonadota bacterium]
MSAAESERGGRTGVLGGTFDPVHLGHLAVAEHAFASLQLNRVLFIPAARPPHKPDLKITPFVHRAAMLELALQDRPGFVLSTMEEKRSGPSFSVDTLRELRSVLGEAEKIFFLIGMDAFAEIATWKNYRLLPELCDLVVIDRPDFPLELMKKTVSLFDPDPPGTAGSPGRNRVRAGAFHALAMEPVDISSTRIRKTVGEGGAVRGLVPPGVADYIEKKGLYRV